jgi:signal transduction histidine kinase
MYGVHVLVKKLSLQERSKMEVWAEATRELATADDDADMTLVLKVLNGNTTIPVVIVDKNDQLVSKEYGIRNIELPKKNADEFIKNEIQRLKTVHTPIPISIDYQTTYYVYYDESFLIKNLSLVSYLVIFVTIVIVMITLLAFANYKKAEQNQLWVGFSKETAHQLGTPISSLLAWLEILKSLKIDARLIKEMGEDINRLSVIAERFSKIGSKPELKNIPLYTALEKALLYIKTRSSKKVEFQTIYQIPRNTEVKLSIALFEWVIENLCKNAIDAMDGEGKIEITVTEQQEYVCIDVRDTGKGISKSKFKTVFQPGYTTKKRGWGLGLSFVNRIVTDYHKGKIFVKQSEINVGTTFRIQLLKIDKLNKGQ